MTGAAMQHEHTTPLSAIAAPGARPTHYRIVR